MNNLDLVLYKMKVDKKQEALAKIISKQFCIDTETYESFPWTDTSKLCSTCSFNGTENCYYEGYEWLMKEVKSE